MKRVLACLFFFVVLLPRTTSAQITWTKYAITTDFGGACSIHAEDINGDSLVDVIAAGFSFNGIVLWTNNGGSPISWEPQTLDTMFYGACFVFADDIDGDNDPDVLACAWHGSELAWWENGGGYPIAWTKHSISVGFFNAHEITAADMDGDDDIDVIGAAALSDEIAWFENDGLNPPGWVKHTIADDFDGARSVKTADIDGDGLLDVVGAALLADAVTWWRNNGDTTWTEYPLDTTFSSAHMVYARDIDADGDSDIVAAAYASNDIAWWRNDGGTPVQFTKQIIDGSLLGALGVFVADINNDSHMDVLGTADITDDVVWYSNNGVQPITWSQATIDGNCNGAWPVYAADLDNDGDNDVLAAAYSSDDIYWYENSLLGISTGNDATVTSPGLCPTIISGPLQLPPGSSITIFDISGRAVAPDGMGRGIYFIQSDGNVCRKVIKVE